ncbi:hypothetical protein QYE76_038497 [Lolium multiflorum]|uniref:CCHC-type domain-containing protein n=1 Tax=Lolium multiflorum TaxID=4521 RepID=A0AAD8T7Z4_LOLMU|nr:hypothetical protein QYE76_038497 [Lolium multiflorum]
MVLQTNDGPTNPQRQPGRNDADAADDDGRPRSRERNAKPTLLQRIAQNNQGHGNHDHPGSKLSEHQPTHVQQDRRALGRDDWLQTMENNLEVAGVEAAEKVIRHPLHRDTELVDKCRAMNAGQMMTCEDFKLKFSKYHVPQGLIKKMRDEFRELKQGRMSMVEYRDRFLTLSRYAPDETDTNEKRKERFLNGLHDEMQTVLVNIPFADLEALVDSAIQMEGKLHQANENRKRRMMNQNGPNNAQNNSNNGNNNNTNTGPMTGSNVVPVNPKDKSTINCYECGVVGHYSNECPKKLAKIATNTAAPAQQQRRFAAIRNQNNHNGRLYHMNATEAQEAPQAMPNPRDHHAQAMPERAPAPLWTRQYPRCPVASVLLSLSPCARSLITTPVHRQTRAIGRACTVAVAMIKPLPPRYCEHSNIASTPQTTPLCAITLISFA